MAMNYDVADKAPADRLNEIIWASVKGLDSTQPPTPRGPKGLSPRQADDGDDDE
jgi:hypothetical protein